jgi:hypothetical protein
MHFHAQVNRKTSLQKINQLKFMKKPLLGIPCKRLIFYQNWGDQKFSHRRDYRTTPAIVFDEMAIINGWLKMFRLL